MPSRGHLRGGLGHVNVLASMIFGGISGSSVADTSAIGAILIPAMREQGYDAEFSAGITAASSTIGILIPPSIPMVIYGITVGASIGALFLAGAIPGILVGLFQMCLVAFIAGRRGYPCGQRFSLRRLLRSLVDNVVALMMPVIILGGIVGGIVTPTEAAATAVLYALVVGFFVYRELNVRDLPRILLETGLHTGVVLMIVAAASSFSWVLSVEQVPQTAATFLASLGVSKMVLLLLINILLLVVGCFLDVTPAIIVLAPILYPVALRLGVDPVQFGAIMVVNLGIGPCTPPVGNCLYVTSLVSGVPIMRLSRAALPFLAANVVTLLLVTYVPWISTALPRLLMR